MQEIGGTEVFRIREERVWMLSETVYTPHFVLWPCMCQSSDTRNYDANKERRS